MVSYETSSIVEKFLDTRARTLDICAKLEKEDYVVQPVVDVSPPKWHLGHTTWFFEAFVLAPHVPDYLLFHPEYHYVFNSYYESLGARVIRTDRGNLSRPTVDEVYRYRQHVDRAMLSFLNSLEDKSTIEALVTLGLNHEQQHQELLWYDIKYILGHNPLFPKYDLTGIDTNLKVQEPGWTHIEAGVYDIGYKGKDFHFDNERSNHRVFIEETYVSNSLISNGEYLNFMEDGGYENFKHWHAEGWEWLKSNQVKAPLYWYRMDGEWYRYDLSGLNLLKMDEPVMHVSFYEAWAYAQWSGMRLPTEYEWEVAATQFSWGRLWEWTESAYLPYPGFKRVPGPIGEYNGKFMVNQKVLRGASIATPNGHSRLTYRNFFHPHLQWMFSGIRLAKNE